MKTTKRILAVLLAVMMIAAMMATTAFAVEPALTGEGSVTIENAVAGTTYTLYRVFNLSATDGSTLNSYITSSNWDSVVRGAAYSSWFTVAGSTGDVGSVVTPASGFNTPAMAQAFAAQIVTDKGAIAKDGTLTVGTSGTVSFTGTYQYGYYVMVSSRDDDPASGQFTTFTLNSAAGVTKREKNPEYPTLAKTVNGKTGASADIGETLNYVITVEAAAGTDTYTITDTLPDGITYGGSVTVAKDGAPLTEGVANDYVLTVAGQEIKVVLNSSVRNALTDGSVITVTYTGKLNSTYAVIAGAGNPNTVKLDYEKDGVADTLNKTATVWTGSLSFDKIASDTSANLAGAKFVLKNKTTGEFAKLDGTDPTYTFNSWVVNQGDATVITTVTSTIEIKGLDADNYVLVETDAPTGYIKAADTDITITATDDGAGNVTGINTPAKATITNTKGTQLPETGGMGTTIFYVVGVVLVLGAVVVLAVKRRKSAQ